MRNREFVFTPKIEYELVAERSEANQNSLTFPFWCSILELVRTHFAACGGEEVPPRKFGKAAELHRSKPQKNPEKNIGSNHILILGEEIFLIQIIKLLLIINQKYMSIENPFNNPVPPQGETPKPEEKEKVVEDPRGIFLGALNDELSAMEKAGRISAEQAEEKRKNAALIETGFSDDPKYDALVFSRAGVADEKELVAIFDKKNAEEELSAPENPEIDSSVADFVGVTESAKHAYGERMEKDISEAEKLELIQAVLSNGRVKRYFERIVSRIKEGMTVEEIIAQDRAEVEARKEITGKEETFETTLRLAELVVKNAKERKEL